MSDAYTTYASTRAGDYYQSASDIAALTYGNTTAAADRTAQEVGTLAGDEYTFETQLADLVYQYRGTMAQADQTYYDAMAQATHDGTSTEDAYDAWTAVTDDSYGSAAQDYQSGYGQRDGQRRQAMAAEGLSFVNDLASKANSTGTAIAADQANFDSELADAYYQGSVAGDQGSGLEYTLATLAENYDIQYATTFANAASNLAGANLGAIWAPWARLASDQAQTQLTTVDIPSANAALAERIAQAVTDNAANIAAGAADRAQWLGDLQTGNSKAIAAAQSTLGA